MPEENVSKAQFEANAALNAQEFANRQILLKGDGQPTSPAPFGAKYIDRIPVPPVTYVQQALGVGANWIPEAQGGSGVNGAIFITDVEPQDPLDNVGQKVFSSDGEVLVSAITNTNLVNVHLIAALGHTNYKPEVTVKGVAVSLTQAANQSIWSGVIAIDLNDEQSLTASHEDGATHEISLVADKGAEITSALFTDGYPTGQTELKRGDNFQLVVSTDSPMTRIEVENFGAAEAKVYDFAETTDITITLDIADQGEVAKNYGVRLRAMNPNGSFGNYFETASQGNEDGVHTLMLNNLYPSGIIDAIEYPVGQVALKDSELAQVDVEASGYDEIFYESPNGQLQIANPSDFQAFKTVERIGGDYNVDESNIKVSLTRLANGAVTELEAVVQIANVDPSVSVNEPLARLRSGGNNGTQVQNHEITLVADQELLEAPVIAVPHGTLVAQMVDSGNKRNWTQNLRVHDDDEKGVFQFSLTQAKNLAGKVVNVLSGDNNYELGGFVSRTLTVPAFQNEVTMGVKVAESSKVVARDKDSILLTYQNDLSDVLKSYAFTSPSQTLNINGDLFFWADKQAVNNNSTGLATITIEEVV